MGCMGSSATKGGKGAAFSPLGSMPKNFGKNDPDENPLHDVDLTIPADSEPITLKNNVIYTGQWKNGKQHGRGRQKNPDGALYTGQFANGEIDGFGRLERPDGSKYEGEFSNGKASTSTRPGVYTFRDGSKYIGQWAADKRHGNGKELMADGSVYEGSYRAGSKHGAGKMVSATGDVYSGEFAHGDMSGEGKYTWPDGRHYQGQWSMSRMHGEGKFYFTDKRLYEGQFSDSRMEGKGKLTWPDGSIYEGEIKYGLPQGTGKFQATATDIPRRALWNQGVRVRWLEDDPNTTDGSGVVAPSVIEASGGSIKKKTYDHCEDEEEKDNVPSATATTPEGPSDPTSTAETEGSPPAKDAPTETSNVIADKPNINNDDHKTTNLPADTPSDAQTTQPTSA